MNSRVAALVVAGVLMLVVGEARGQTELSGAIWGDLVRGGNPHIVVDSCWVPEGETLTVREGVQLLFNEGQGLYVFGTFNMSGHLGESQPIIRLSQDASSWKGIWFYGQHRSEWSYSWIQTPGVAFYLDGGYSFSMDNCGVEVNGPIFRRIDEALFLHGCNLNFSNSTIVGMTPIYTAGGTITADSSSFAFGDSSDTPGFHGEATGFRLNDCWVRGSIYGAGYTIIEYCHFLRANQYTPVYAGAIGGIGRMIGTYVDGGSGVSNMNRDESIPFHNNTITGGCGFSGNAVVANCDIRGRVGVSHSKKVIFKNSMLSRGMEINEVDTMTIDSCSLLSEDPGYNYFSYSGERRVSNLLKVTRCVLKPAMISHNSLDEADKIEFDHNTFVFDNPQPNVFIGNPAYYYLSNNVFIGSNDDSNLFINRNYLPNFSYNCLWRFNTTTNPDDTTALYLDTTNFNADPRLEWYASTPMLAWDSPCIDSGDPNAPLDPDGTRSDIGTLSFFQRDRKVWPRQDSGSSPFNTDLISSFPSPFNSSLTISYSSPTNAPLLLSLVDLSGRTLQQNWLPGTMSGKGVATIGTTTLPSGNYFVIVGGNRDGVVLPVRCLK